ncbi:hypothetical protein REPUB_Repub16aG0113100 [Reevesia pubescens]
MDKFSNRKRKDLCQASSPTHREKHGGRSHASRSNAMAANIKAPPQTRVFKKTYKQVLLENGSTAKESQKVECPVVVLDSKEDEWGWLQNCAIGELLDLSSLSRLQDFLWCLRLKCVIIPMGGNMVVLKAETKDLLTEFIEIEAESWRLWFSNLVLWSPELVLEERQVRMLVSVPFSKMLFDVIEVVLNGSSFPVRIVEDTSKIEPWWEETQSKAEKLLSDKNFSCVCRSKSEESGGYWHDDSDSEVEETMDFLVAQKEDSFCEVPKKDARCGLACQRSDLDFNVAENLVS